MRPDPTLDIALSAERDSALVSGVLHLFAACAVPILLWDVSSDVVRRANLWIFTGAELGLAVLGFSAYLFARVGRRRSFWNFSRAESILAAINFAALAWLGPDVATSTPSKYLLTITLVAVTSIAAANSSMLVRRRGWFHFTITVIGVSHLAAYVVGREVIFGAFTLLWCCAMLQFSRIGFEAMQELLELRRQSEESARHDDLTGLLNRAAFLDELQRRADGRAGDALVLIDLDGFKAINDGFGHASGDAVLQAVADRLDESLPRGTELGRLGGDEFAALVPLASIDLRLTLERLIESVGQAIPVEDRDLYVAGSIGWTEVQFGLSAPQLMAEADAAMYRSKNSSTDSSTGFNDQMRTALDRSLDLRQRFRGVVKGRMIDFLAQPIVRAGDGFPLAIELLARWPREDDIEIGPAEFNQLADETGLAVELDRLALAEAARLLEAWRHDAYLESIIIKVNVSPIHLANLELARSIRELIPEGDRARLGLEFVETKLMAANERTHGLLRELKSTGVTISIDDFGTGYSSLAYLRTLPVSEVKIDRSFVTGVDTDPVNRGLVRAIVDLAGTFGLSTIAEGVESVEELRVIAGLGVDSVQGYFTGRPVGINQVGDYLRERRREIRSTGRPTSSEGV